MLGWLVGDRDGKKLGSGWDPVNTIPTLSQPGPFQTFAPGDFDIRNQGVQPPTQTNNTQNIEPLQVLSFNGWSRKDLEFVNTMALLHISPSPCWNLTVLLHISPKWLKSHSTAAHFTKMAETSQHCCTHHQAAKYWNLTARLQISPKCCLHTTTLFTIAAEISQCCCKF